MLKPIIPRCLESFLDLYQENEFFWGGKNAVGTGSEFVMDRVVAAIAAAPLFNGLTASQLESIRRISVVREYRKGQTVFTEGDDGNGFYIVVSGRVKIFKSSAEGKEQILHIFGPGEPFGEVPVFTGSSFPATALCIAPTRLLFFPKNAFIDLISQHPLLAVQMLGLLSLRLREFTVHIENLSLKEVPGRLSAYLLYLSEEQDQSDQVRLDISKGHLAGLLGTIPETLSRIFSRMTAGGLIRVKGNIIFLLDRESLELLAETGKMQE